MNRRIFVASLGLAIAFTGTSLAQGEAGSNATTRPATRRLIDTEPKILIREHGFTTEPSSPAPDSQPDPDPASLDHSEAERTRDPNVRTSADAVELTKAARRTFDAVKISNPEHRTLGAMVAVVGASVVIFIGVLVMYSRRRRG